MKTRPGSPANAYVEPPDNSGEDLTKAEREEQLEQARKFEAAAVKAEKDGDLAHAQTLRRLLGG
jgi:hypothetical protein